MLYNIAGIISIAAAAGYLAYLASDVRRLRSAAGVFLALLVTALLQLFDLLVINFPSDFLFYKRLSLTAEALLPAVWLAASLSYYRSDLLSSAGYFQKACLLLSPLFLAAAVSMPIDRFYFAPDFDMEKVLFLENYGFAFYVCLLIYLVLSLINLEMTLFSAARAERWQIKFDIIGTGTIIAVLLFYYSQGLLYRTLNMNLVPVRSFVISVSVLLMLYSRTKRGSSVRLYVSKQTAYRSVVIMAVGLYLIGLGLMGEGIRYLGRDTQRAVLISLAFVAAVGLLVLLLSESLKRRVKVLLHKNFYTNKYDYRFQWLRFTERISKARTREEELNAILECFSETFGFRGSGLYLLEPGGNRYCPAALNEMKAGETSFPDDNALITYMKREKRIFSVGDNLKDIMDANRAFIENTGTVFAVPIYSAEDMPGFIALAGQLNTEEEYTYEDFDLMNTLARQVCSVIVSQRLSDELSVAREMEMIGRVSSFVIHDLKNLATTLSLIIENSHEHIDDPEFQKDMLKSLDATVRKMRDITGRLKEIREKDCLCAEPADLFVIAADAVAQVNGGNISLQGSSVTCLVDKEEIHKVVLNLLLNAVEASSDGKGITVETGMDKMAYVRVSDQGCGMSPEFQQKQLFKPFVSTKKKGLGIGLYQCRQIIEAHSGRFEVDSIPGRGSVFTVFLPLPESLK